MSRKVTILHLEDSAQDSELIVAQLAKAGVRCALTRVDTRAGFEAALHDQRFDLILADFSLPSFDGLAALDIARRDVPSTPFLFFSGDMGEEAVAEALKRGARDYVPKRHLARLPAAVTRAIAEARTLAERRQAEENLRRLHQAIADIRDYAIVMLDLTGRITSWNEGCRRLFGHSAAEALNHPLSLLFAPEERSLREVEEMLAHAADKGRHEVEWTHAARDGRRFNGSCVLTTVRDESGRPVAYSMVVRDITDRLVADAALRQSEDRFRTIANAMPQMVWTATPEGDPDYYNRNWYHYTGDLSGASFGERWVTAIHPDDRAASAARWRQAVDSGQEYEVEYRIRRADGNFRWFLGRAVPLRDGEGRIVRWFGTCTDIDDAVCARTALARSRKELERLVEERTAELVAANERLRAEVAEREHAQASLEALYAKTPVPLHSLDADGRLLTVSDRWLEFMGHDCGDPVAAEASRRDVLGRPISDFMTEPAARALRERCWPDLLRFGAAPDVPYQLVRKSGEVMDVLVSSRVERDGRGGFLRVMAAVVDVTARLRAEAERERAEEALRQAQKMDALGQLTGGIAHDFNNLLTAITGNLELLLAKLGGDDIDALRTHAGNAKAGATRAAALTQRLLAFARRQPLRPGLLDPCALVHGMEDLLRRTVGEQVAIETRCEDAGWSAWCDTNQLEIALLNLAVNARDAMPDGGRIVIAIDDATLGEEEIACAQDMKPGEFVVISVADSGCGMTSDVLARAFDPFFTTKPIGQGTGLGLSQVYGFVNQSQGFVRIESVVGRGTIVRLYLPRCRDGQAVAPSVTVPPAGQDAAAAGTVLVVEDEALVRMVAVQALEDAGMRVVEAADGTEALGLLENGLRVDLMVTDVGLPGMNGRQLAEAARDRRPDLNVLFMTGYAYDKTLGKGILEPNWEVLSKPFETGALVARVSGMLANGAGAGRARHGGDDDASQAV